MSCLKNVSLRRLRFGLPIASISFALSTAMGCASVDEHGAERPNVENPSEGIRPSAESGIELSALDTATSPCDDFYQYACGGWLKNTDIPVDEPVWSRTRNEAGKRNQEILRQILEGFANGENAGEPYAKSLGDFYGACMDQTAIERAGMAPLASWFSAIDALTDPASLLTFLGRTKREFGSGVLVEAWPLPNFNDSTRTSLFLSNGALGMPNRSYYLDASPAMAAMRARYEAHVVALLKLAGDSEDIAKTNAKKVLALETSLAKVTSANDERGMANFNLPVAKADLETVAPGLDWGVWLASAGTGQTRSSNDVFTFDYPYLRALSSMINGGVSIADWKLELRWTLLNRNASYLSQAFVNEDFAWNQAFTGATAIAPRWSRCASEVDSALGDALGQAFVKKTIGDGGKVEILTMIAAIETAMRDTIKSNLWMDASTKAAALAKLEKVANKIAFPETWRNYDGLAVTRESYWQNRHRSAVFESERNFAQVGKPVDRTKWNVTPATVQAYYGYELNEMVFTAGILQPPFYSPTSARSVKFGGIGMIMGHEITHGFDGSGRLYDLNGNRNTWWSDNDNKEYERRSSCLVDQFDKFVAIDDLRVNGKLTLNENIADLGGLKLAYKALAEGGLAPAGEGRAFSESQEFFISNAQLHCTKHRDEAVRARIATDTHSPERFRVNGPMANMPEFAEAFGCATTTAMVKKDRCEVW